MGESDPHVHVDVNVVRADAAVRNVLASAFGLVGELPGAVTTGCGLRVARARTSLRPESVTCLACREHAAREHLRFAGEVERLGRMPGAAIDPEKAELAVRQYRELARRFGGDG
jgi:hypothetical protein